MRARKLGQLGESIAESYLKSKKYKILEKNFKRKWGEIDIVAQKKGRFIFVEVKTIQKNQGFFPEDKINWKKKNQLRKMAQIYLLENNISLFTPWQIDIIAIEIGNDFKEPEIRHYQNAIEDTC